MKEGDQVGSPVAFAKPRGIRFLDALFLGWPASVPFTFGVACGLSVGLNVSLIVELVTPKAELEIRVEANDK